MSETMTAQQSFGLVQQSAAERIDRSAPQQFPEAASLGDGIRQGDCYLELTEIVNGRVRVFDRDEHGNIVGSHLADIVGVESPSLQIAVGTTQGARHCLDSLEGVTVYRLAEPTELDGPILLLQQERTLQHPEHGHWILPADGRVYNTGYQRMYAEELQRVMD
jgi:hypothetical protein